MAPAIGTLIRSAAAGLKLSAAVPAKVPLPTAVAASAKATGRRACQGTTGNEAGLRAEGQSRIADQRFGRERGKAAYQPEAWQRGGLHRRLTGERAAGVEGEIRLARDVARQGACGAGSESQGRRAHTRGRPGEVGLGDENQIGRADQRRRQRASSRRL